MINENVGNVPLTQEEKARRWDNLLRLLKPGAGEDQIFHLNIMRRAVLALLERDGLVTRTPGLGYFVKVSQC